MNTTISEDIINNGTIIANSKGTIEVSGKSINQSTNNSDYDYTYSEYYEELLDMDAEVTKSALADTASYKFIAYNVGAGDTEAAAIAAIKSGITNVNNWIQAGSFKNRRSVPNSSENDYVIIDFYYSTYDRDVEVNHLYVDEDGVVLAETAQTIKPNQKAITGEDRINGDTKVVEIYKKSLGTIITTGTSKNLDSGVVYKGYETFTYNPAVSNLAGTQREDLNTATEYTFTSNGDAQKIKQVNYYYYKENKEKKDPPDKDIEGEVFVEPLEDIVGQCSDDGESIIVTSMPSGTNAKVGIMGIPRLMLGALETKYVSVSGNDHTLDFDIQLKYGSDIVKISYSDIAYKVGYYKITDMAVYQLVKSTIYDAGHGYDGTLGEKLFTWNSGKKEFDQSTDIKVQRYGIDNTKISASDVDKLENYLKIELVDTKNGKSKKLSLDQKTAYTITYSSKAAFENIVGPATNRYSKDKITNNLGLELKLTVQNMLVEVEDGLIGKVEDNLVERTYDLSEYLSFQEKPFVKTGPTVIYKSRYEQIGEDLLSKEDYTNTNAVDKSVLNGVRALAGKAEYEASVLIGSKQATAIEDTTYYADQSSSGLKVIFNLSQTKLTKNYKVNNTVGATQPSIKFKEVKPINVYTPITVSATLASNKNVLVNQTDGKDLSTSIIQLKVPFTITFDSSEPENQVYNIDNTNEYSKGYYVKFDFDVHNVYVNGALYKKGNVIKAGTWIGMAAKNAKGNVTVTATAHEGGEGTNILEEEMGKYTVRAVAYNATNQMLTESVKYSILNEIIQGNNSLKDMLANICKSPSYFAEKEYGVAILNRAYDFKITDLSDVSWKNVFRTNSSGAVNTHTGKLYYAGVSKWRNTSEKLNEIISRTTYEIGRNPLRILPIGPYKNTDTTYVGAPKLGYKFSYDLKVSGAYYKTDGSVRTDKKVQITTNFYYISKDGKTYLPEYTGSGEGIYLFYKTSNGKYVKVGETGGDYQISMTPNDGYRYIEDTDRKYLSTNSLVIGNLRKLTLTYKMATPVDKEEAITYYGEYKLPNSTIAVKVDKDGKYDINSPLKNGYIGVIFDIVAYSGTANINGKNEDIKLSYAKDSKVNTPNTSQWDYEGFLGYTGYGEEVAKGTLNMKLEKGVWNITNKVYNDIKGSVILYDIDKRADTDYE